MNIMNEREENFKALKNKKKDAKEFVREEEYYNRTEFIQKVKKCEMKIFILILVVEKSL